MGEECPDECTNKIVDPDFSTGENWVYDSKWDLSGYGALCTLDFTAGNENLYERSGYIEDETYTVMVSVSQWEVLPIVKMGVFINGFVAGAGLIDGLGWYVFDLVAGANVALGLQFDLGSEVQSDGFIRLTGVAVGGIPCQLAKTQGLAVHNNAKYNVFDAPDNQSVYRLANYQDHTRIRVLVDYPQP